MSLYLRVSLFVAAHAGFIALIALVARGAL